MLHIKGRRCDGEGSATIQTSRLVVARAAAESCAPFGLGSSLAAAELRHFAAVATLTWASAAQTVCPHLGTCNKMYLVLQLSH